MTGEAGNRVMCVLLPADAGGDLRMANGQRSTVWVIALILLPLLTIITQEIGLDPAPVVEAATNCTLKDGGSTPAWGTTIEKEVLISEGDEYYYGDEGGWDEDYEYWNTGLSRLEEGFHTSFFLANDSAVSLRMNLTTGWKYTFCIDFQPEYEGGNQATPIADVYLLKEMDRGRYQWDYTTRNNLGDGFRDGIEDSPPWMQNAIFWHPFRDVHSYEKVDEVKFAVSLDHEERSQDPWSDSIHWQTMYLMIDSWDNIRQYDAGVPNRNFTVDLVVMVEERFALPNWTVTMVCCGALLGILAAPFLVHHRYMKAGLDPMVSDTQMDHLKTEGVAPVVAIAPAQPEPVLPPPDQI